MGGVAAALAAAEAGRRVVLTEPTTWIGGQLTSQAVPPDEHPWIEQFGATETYRRLRAGIRARYRTEGSLSERARSARWLNPGSGSVSVLCHEPRVALTVLQEMLRPHQESGRVRLLLHYRPVAAARREDHVTSVTLTGGGTTVVRAAIVIDASELGDLLPLAGISYLTGAEARSMTGEPHAPDEARPQEMQGFTVCMALDYLEGEDHTIERPAEYGRWRAPGAPIRTAPQIGWPVPDPAAPFARTLRPNPDPATDAGVVVSASYRGRFDPPPDYQPVEDLWRFRRIAARANFDPPLPSDITIVNWSANDYIAGSLVDVSEPEARRNLEGARQLTLSLLYWLQTEAPRPDGGRGFPGLRPRGDVVGTPDGLAMAPYIREARRIRADCTVTELDFAAPLRTEGPAHYPDSVGIGSYKLDLHPSTQGGARRYERAWPFEIPMGALIPVGVSNVLAGAKNIGTTHLSNGAYRVHPVEWNIGESAGALAAYCLNRGLSPRQVRASPAHLAEFQARLEDRGVELRWPRIAPY